MLTIVCCGIREKIVILQKNKDEMDDDILKRFGLTIKQLRERKGISQEKLGEISDLHRTYIGMIERAERNITLKNIEKLAKALGTDISKIFEELESTNTNKQ